MSLESDFDKIREELKIARNNIDRQSPHPVFCNVCMNIIVHLALGVEKFKQDNESRRLFYCFIIIMTNKYCGFKDSDSIPRERRILQIKKNRIFVSWFVEHCIHLNQIDYQTRLSFLEEEF